MFKRTISLICAFLILLISLASCTQSSVPSTDSDSETESVKIPETSGSDTETGPFETERDTSDESGNGTETVQDQPTETEKETETDKETETEKETQSYRSLDLKDQNTISPASTEAGTGFWDLSSVKRADVSSGLTLFVFETSKNPELPFGVACRIQGQNITAVIPAGLDRSALIPTFEYKGSGNMTDEEGHEIVSGMTALDLTSQKKIVFHSGSGITYKVTVENLNTGLSTMCVTTDEFAGITDKVTPVPVTVTVSGGESAVSGYPVKTVTARGTIKGRGNTSWHFPKKGYNIKLEEKVQWLGLASGKSFCLVSNYQDKSLLRNAVAAYFSEALGLTTMHVRFVDLYLNGSYWGNYTLIEKIVINKNRINVTEYKAPMVPDECGYILEWDGHVNEVSDSQKNRWEQFGQGYYDPVADMCFCNVDGHWMTFKSPDADELTPDMLDYVVNRWKTAYNIVHEKQTEKISDYIDMASYAGWYLVEDMLMNMDASFHSSCYMVLDQNGVFHMGPVWDFDLGAGNCNYGNRDTSTSYLQGSYIIKYLLRLPVFQQILLQVYDRGEYELRNASVFIDEWTDRLELSARYNFEKWKILDKKVGANDNWVLEYNTFHRQQDYLIQFLSRRYGYISAFVEQYAD